MSLLGYAASGILKNRRRTLSSILGVLLAITFISGTFIAIDSSTRATLDAVLQVLPGDFSYTASPLDAGAPTSTAASNGSLVRNALAAVPGVTDVSVYRLYYLWSASLELYNPSATVNNSQYVGAIEGIDPYHLPYTLHDALVSGSLLLPNGTVAMDSQTANALQVNLGDTVVLQSRTWSNGTPTTNTSVSLTVGALVTLSTQYYPYGPIIGPGPIYYGSTFAVNLRDSDWLVTRLVGATAYSSQIQGEVWIDRAKYVNLYDAAATAYQLTRLGRSLNAAIFAANYSGSVTDNISPAISTFTAGLSVQRFIYLIFSSPVILLGLYLGAVGVDLSHVERRRELGVLKTRGASRGQVAMQLVLESVLGGLVATILGLLLGIGLSRILMAAIVPFGTTTDYGTISLTPETIIVVAILSTIFMIIVSVRSARRTASLPVIETLRYYAPGETRIHYSPVLDLVLIGYSVLTYVLYWYLQPSAGDVFVFLIELIITISLLVVPILLIVGIVRMATRSTGRVYEAASRLVRPLAPNLEQVMSRNLSRNPRRSSNIAIIIALGLAFGIFIFSALGSQQATQQARVWANVGSDLSVEVPYSYGNGTTPPNYTISATNFAANLSQVPGVAQITHVTPLWVSVSPTGSVGNANVFALDPSTYFSVAQPAPFYFEDPSTASAAQQVLATKGEVLITGRFANDAALQVGDSLFLSATVYSNLTQTTVTVTAHVGGIVRFLPGTFNGYFSGSMSAPDEVYASFATVTRLISALQSGPYVTSGDKFLASFLPGADWHAVKADVLALGALNVQVYQEQLAQLNANPFLGSYLGFIEMEIAFIVVILTAGLGLIIYAASLERTVEFAGITARGASGWQTAGLLVGEAFVILLIGLAIGVAVGLLTGWLSVTATFTGYTTGEPIVPTLFVFPVEGLVLLILAPVAMLGTTVLVAWRIAHMNVARVLKMRGG